MPHLAALADLCRRHPTARKVVFAPSEQAGRAARAALSRAGVAYVGLEVTTPAAHARDWLPPAADAAGLRPLPYFAEGFILDALLAQQEERGVTALSAAARGPGPLRDTVEALRNAGIEPSTLRAGAGHRRTALAELLAGYETELERGAFLDDARTLRLATDEVSTAPPDGTIYAVFDETRLAPLEERFVRALTEDGRTLERIGFGTPGLAPARRSALALFWPDAAGEEPPEGAGAGAWLGVDNPPAPARDSMRAQLRVTGDVYAGIRRSVGAGAEVRDALRDVLQRGLALDEVEIAYAANDPYLMLLHAEMRLRDLAVDDENGAGARMPMTFAAGVPLGHTRFGQALRGLLDWLAGDYDTSVLVRLLQGRLLLLDRPDGVTNRWAAHDLIRGGTATGTGAHVRTLDRAARVHREGLKRGGDESAVSEALSSLDATRAALDRLAAHLPDRSAAPAAYARGLRGALEEFGPVDAAAVSRREAHEVLTPDERAFVIVRDRLRSFVENAPDGAPLPPPRAAVVLRDALASAFVGALRPQPGHLHVVPLASAGYAGRRHLYVVGLDAQTSAPWAGEDAVLPDRDRDEIDVEGRLERGSDRAGAQSWDFARALARIPAEGSVTLCARSHDPAGGDTLYPGGLLLRVADLAGLDLKEVIAGRGVLTGLVPDLGTSSIALHDAEVDLALREIPRRQETLAERFPIAVCGRIADDERRSPRWTIYDGWLGEPAAGLDPLAVGGVVSPSRLEDLATCPYRYFVKHVLKRQPPPEALDESQLLNPAERGSLLHSVFEQFSRGLRERGEQPTLEHESEVVAIAERLVDEVLEQRGEPAAPARDALRRSMVSVARLYLLDEVRHAGAATPVAFEHGFGFDEPVPLALAEDVIVPLRGFVDRVELRADGSYEIVDFKTGSSFGFADPGQDPQKVMAGGKKLQWALYAYALRQSEGWDVRHAGYRFLSVRELAERRSYPLPPQRLVANILRQVVAPARGGFFPQKPSPTGACRFCECRRACGDVQRRVDEIAAAAASVAYDMDADPTLRNWSSRYLD